MNDGIVLENFIGGVNEAIDPTLLKSNEAKNATNVSIDDGTLSLAGGYTRVFPNTQYADIKTIMTYYKDFKGILLLAIPTKVIALRSDTDKAEILINTLADVYDYVNFNVDGKDIIIFSNGKDAPFMYDGTSCRNLLNRRKVYNDDGTLRGYVDANGVEKTNIADITTLAPKGKFLELHYERIWVAGDETAPSTVYFSTADVNGFDPEDFTMPVDEDEVNMHGGSIDVYSNDGGVITALKVVFDDILIFKTKSIFKIFGNNPTNYTKIQIFSSNGAIADRTIVSATDGAYFINKDAIYKYDGSNVAPISQKINSTFSKLNKEHLHKATATFWKNKYILACPYEASTTNTLLIIYDTLNRNYTFLKGVDVNSFVDFGDELLFTNSTGKIYSLGKGDKFDTANINAVYETGDFTLNYLNAVKDIESFYFLGSGNGDIKITCTTDRKVKEKIVTLTGEDKVYKVRLKNRGRLFRYKIENINGSNFKIKAPKIILEMDVD